MADQKINDLSAAGSVSSTMQFETDLGGTTAQKVTGTQIRSYCQSGVLLAGATDLDDITQGATNKYLTVDAGTDSLISYNATAAYNEGDLAIGLTATAGTNGTATDLHNTAIGNEAIAQGRKTTAIGSQAEVSTQTTPSTNSVAVGDRARVLGSGKSVALGNDTTIEEAESAIAIGSTASVGVGADNGICIGSTSTITLNGLNSVAIGAELTVNKEECVILGYDSDDAWADWEFSYGARYLRFGQIRNSGGTNPGVVGSLPVATTLKEGSAAWVTDGYNSNDALALVADLGSGKQWYYIPPNIADLVGGGAVDSVNTQTGVVVLDADDISDTSTTNKYVTASDVTNLGNLSGTNSGDQTITLTGDVTGAGTGSFATTIATDAVDISMLSATGTASSSTFLRGDNTWAAPAGGGGGDLLAANNLSDVGSAVTSRTNLGVAIGSDVQAFSSVLAATTASFLTTDETKLDGIEASATANTGALADLDTVDTAQVDDDAITIAKLAATGTASSSTFLRGDNTWATPAGGGGGDLLAANNLSDVANAGTSRTNLGLAIGSDVQAFSSVLAATTASFLTADETKLDGIATSATANPNAVDSDNTGITGADEVSNMVSLTTAEYGAITPNATTLYFITDAV